MKIFLDIQTTSIVLGAVILSLSLCLTHHLIERKNYMGFRELTAGVVLFGSGIFLIALRDRFPDFITIIVANTAIYSGMISIYTGLVLFSGGKRHVAHIIVGIPIGVILLAYFTYITPDVGLRISLTSFFCAFYFCLCGLVLTRHIGPLIGSVNKLLMVSFIGFTILLTGRGIFFILPGNALPSYTSGNLVHELALLSMTVFAIFMTVGWIQINTQRLEVDLRKGQAILKERETILHRSQEIAGMGSYVYDLKTHVLDWSRNMNAIYGLAEKPFAGTIGDAIRKFIHRNDRSYVQGEFNKMVSQKTIRPIQFRITRPDGTERIIHSTGEMMPDENGHPAKIIGVHQDITHRIKAEKEKDLLLSQTKQKAMEMEALFNGTRLLLEEKNFKTTARKIFDICRKVTGAQSGYVALLSSEGDENEVLFLESGGLPCAVNPDLPMPVRGLRAEAYRSAKTVYDNDFPNSHWMKFMPKGHVRLNNVLFAPIKDKGHAVGLIGLANKAGEFTDADAKMVTTLGELAAISMNQNFTKKALEESERHLRQTQKLEAIGNLAGGIAHDFNNILSAILGYTELSLDDTPKDSQMHENLCAIYTAGKRAKDLVRQILTFSHRVDTAFKPIQVDMIAREALKLLRSTIPTSININSDIQSTSTVLGDATQIHQIFMNLCTNAAQAMGANGGEIRITLSDTCMDSAFTKRHMGLPPGDYLRIKIFDTGSGISPEHIEHIFDPYFTTKKIGQGTGMGLATVHGIVKACNGVIFVESGIGSGTAFTIYLPVFKNKTEKIKNATEPIPAGTERILIVDDEVPIARMTGMMLNRMGYNTTVRTSSLEALALFQMRPDDFDLVITDMTMPHMTGNTLAVELNKIRPDIPIILCTGYSGNISAETAARIGIRAFLHKPLTKAELAKTIRSALDRPQKTDSTAPVEN